MRNKKIELYLTSAVFLVLLIVAILKYNNERGKIPPSPSIVITAPAGCEIGWGENSDTPHVWRDQLIYETSFMKDSRTGAVELRILYIRRKQ